MRKLIVALVSVSSLFACGGKGSPTAPDTSTPPATTQPPVTQPPAVTLQSLDMRANLSALNLPGATAQTTVMGTFSNGTTQNITSSCTNWFSDNPFALTVSAGGMLTAKNSGQSTVTTDCQGRQGRGLITVTLLPVWVHAGTGDTVFDMPSHVRRVRVVADYTSNSSNLMVDVNGRNLVNELVGRGWNQTHFEGTYVTSGGVVEVTNSSGVKWSLTEVR